MTRVQRESVGDVSIAARSAGLGDRYRYWGGRSGRRYLFSAVNPADLGQFRAAVVLFAEADPTGVPVARWITTVDAGGRWRDASGGDTAIATGARQVFVHLLARGPTERDQVLADLLPAVLADAA